MRLFLYGTLLDGVVLASRAGQAGLAARLMPATLPGWRRVGMRGGRYPTLRRDRSGCVFGALAEVPARAAGRLAAYEGPAYRLRRLVVVTPRRRLTAGVWIAAAGTRRPWKE
jgi:hypothetical protein